MTTTRVMRRRIVVTMSALAVVLGVATGGSRPIPAQASVEQVLTPAPLPTWTATIQRYTVPAPGAQFNALGTLTVGPDNNLWSIETSDAATSNIEVNQITPAGIVTQFADPRLHSALGSITAGPDGALWYTVPQTYISQSQGYAPARVGRVSTNGSFTSFSLPGTFQPAVPAGITTGPDGNLWMAGNALGGDGLASMTTSGQVTAYKTSAFNDWEIVTGPDRNLWFTDSQIGIGRVTPAGVVTDFPIPKSAQNPSVNSATHGITAGPDGALWFTEPTADVIGRITTTGIMAFYPVPTTSAGPQEITAGHDGNLWFTEQQIGRIGRLNPATGVITEFRGPTLFNRPYGITAGPDGKIWFTDQLVGASCQNNNGNDADCLEVDSLDPATSTPPPAPCLTVTQDTTLTTDLGPCGGDGIDVTASNIRLNLNGHKVFSAQGTRYGDYAGIRLDNVTGVVVRGGEVTGFDGGVLLDRGSGNTITGVNVHDNLGSLNQFASLLGDGIVAMHSSGNLIATNIVVNNGFFDGIGLLGIGTDSNTIRANLVENNNGTGLVENPFLELENPDRGSSLSGNQIINNAFTGNNGDGISNASSMHAMISGNTVANNTLRGIGVSHLIQAAVNTYVTVTGNRVTGNGDNGIEVTAQSNTITDNVATGNGAVGSAFGSGYDLADFAPVTKQNACTNTWKANTWGSGGYNTPCVTAGGSGPNPPSASASSNPTVTLPQASSAGGAGRHAAPA